MFQDVLRESWVYQEIGQEFLEEGREEGRREGREEERQQALQRERTMLLRLVQAHFPELSDLAQQQVESIDDPHILYHMYLELVRLQSPEDAKRIILTRNGSS
jgi:predicted transposase YdaD